MHFRENPGSRWVWASGVAACVAVILASAGGDCCVPERAASLSPDSAAVPIPVEEVLDSLGVEPRDAVIRPDSLLASGLWKDGEAVGDTCAECPRCTAGLIGVQVQMWQDISSRMSRITWAQWRRPCLFGRF